MGTIQTDPIIAEVRAIRDEHAARFGYDVSKILRDIKSMQKASGQVFIRYLARKVAAESTGGHH